MSLDKEAREFNERQKRYREQENLHKHMGGADHKELMRVLNKMEQSLGYLIDMLRDHIDTVEYERENKNPYQYRSQRGFIPKYEEGPARRTYTSSYQEDDPHLRSSSAGSFDMGKEWLKDMRDQMNKNFGEGANDGLIIDPDGPHDDRNSDE